MLFVFTFVSMPALTPHINHLFQQHFDKVLVLTLPRSIERHKKVTCRLKGICFDFFYGVDKNDLNANFISCNYLYDKKTSLAVWQVFKEMTIGEIACALSHRSIYQAIIDNNWNRVLILEDDVVPEYTNLTLLADAFKELPENWELFYLGYLKNEKRTFKRKLKQGWYKILARLGLSHLSYKMVNRLLPQEFSKTLLKAGFHDCTHAYALKLEAAKKLLKMQTPVKYRADNVLTALILKGELNAFTSRSVFFTQEIFNDKTEKSYVKDETKPQLK